MRELLKGTVPHFEGEAMTPDWLLNYGVILFACFMCALGGYKLGRLKGGYDEVEI